MLPGCLLRCTWRCCWSDALGPISSPASCRPWCSWWQVQIWQTSTVLTMTTTVADFLSAPDGRYSSAVSDFLGAHDGSHTFGRLPWWTLWQVQLWQTSLVFMAAGKKITVSKSENYYRKNLDSHNFLNNFFVFVLNSYIEFILRWWKPFTNQCKSRSASLMHWYALCICSL